MAITRQNTLPDPNYRFGDSGESTSGAFGPGFKSITFKSQTQIAKNLTNSGRMVRRFNSYHKWEISITYNPMTREEFEPVYNFLLDKQGSLEPFFVSLPHLRGPQDSTFATYCQSNETPVDGFVASGSTSLKADGFTGSSGSPKRGDIFTLTDAYDSNHTKVYQVTSVEVNEAGKFETVVGDDERIIHFSPAVNRSVSDDTLINFHQPLIRVTMASDMQEYSLGSNGLYQFSLKLEEAQQ